MTKALNDEDRQARSYAAYVLLIVNPKAKAAVPALTEALEDPDKVVRI